MPRNDIRSEPRLCRGSEVEAGRGLRRAWRVLVALGATAALGCSPSPGVVDTGEASDATGTAGTTTGSTSSTAADTTAASDTATTSMSSVDSSTTGPTAECGNGAIEDGEECEGEDLGDATCESLGYAPGPLMCAPTCMLDASGCAPPGMRLVPGGAFTMGSLRFPESQPVREVNVDAFFIDETEVTTAEYTECVVAMGCPIPTEGSANNYGVAGREDHPINGVDFAAAQAYCAWVDGGVKRLPTEAEWEKAARGTDARTYPWGDAPEPSCTHVVMDERIAPGCGMDSTWVVGSKPLGVSPYGVLDMGGNVGEWVSDWFAQYEPSDTDNPTGPSETGYRIVRGGGYRADSAELIDVTNRQPYVEEFNWNATGFRCVQPVIPK